LTSTLALCGDLRNRTVPPFLASGFSRIISSYSTVHLSNNLAGCPRNLPHRIIGLRPTIFHRLHGLASSNKHPKTFIRNVHPQRLRTRHLSLDTRNGLCVFTVFLPISLPMSHKPTTMFHHSVRLSFQTNECTHRHAFLLPQYLRFFRSTTLVLVSNTLSRCFLFNRLLHTIKLLAALGNTSDLYQLLLASPSQRFTARCNNL